MSIYTNIDCVNTEIFTFFFVKTCLFVCFVLYFLVWDGNSYNTWHSQVTVRNAEMLMACTINQRHMSKSIQVNQALLLTLLQGSQVRTSNEKIHSNWQLTPNSSKNMIGYATQGRNEPFEMASAAHKVEKEFLDTSDRNTTRDNVDIKVLNVLDLLRYVHCQINIPLKLPHKHINIVYILF